MGHTKTTNMTRSSFASQGRVFHRRPAPVDSGSHARHCPFLTLPVGNFAMWRPHPKVSVVTPAVPAIHRNGTGDRAYTANNWRDFNGAYPERSNYRQDRGGLQRRPAGGAEGTAAGQRATGSGTGATLCSGVAGRARPAQRLALGVARPRGRPYSPSLSEGGSGGHMLIV